MVIINLIMNKMLYYTSCALLLIIMSGCLGLLTHRGFTKKDQHGMLFSNIMTLW